jgi:hypothetical protein
VEECTTFEGKKKIQFGVGEKKLCCPNYFLNLWAVQIRKLILEAKFGGPVQRRDKAGWPNQGQGLNLEP